MARAFEDPSYDYYRLTKDVGPMKVGTIFYSKKYQQNQS